MIPFNPSISVFPTRERRNNVEKLSFLAPDYHNCTNVTVPNNLYCYENTANYTFDCPRSCPMDCMDSDVDPVCASDLGTYGGSCDKAQKVCELYARELIDQEDMDGAAEVLKNITITNNEQCPSKENLMYRKMPNIRPSNISPSPNIIPPTQ